jgi:phosphotriesterase-related protein
MPQVQTVRGAADVSRLGATLMHEHIFILTPDVQQNYPEDWGDEDARVADAVTQLRALAVAGIKTIVDLTVLGQGRYIPRIQRVAEQVPELNIVVATGCYIFDEVPLFFSGRTPRMEASLGRPAREVMVDFFVRDITAGIAATGVRAGMLKCAVDTKGLTRGVERVLRAVCRAHVQTGTPVTIHTHAASRHGPAILEVLKDEGADLSRIVLGHSGDATQPDYLEAMAKAGVTLGMDRFGIDHFASFAERADLVVELCKRGLADHMVLSHDYSCYLDWFPPGFRDNLKHWHYQHISRDVLPYLREHGVTAEQIDAMLVHNPARILGPTSRGPA